MNKEELDKLLAAMIEFADGISDLLFVAGRPMQVETQGELKPFVHELAESALTSERIEGMANVIINNNPRLLQDLKEHGSCDCGYTLKNACRFRVNIYFQNGNYAMVLRHLKPLIPTFDTLKLGPTFAEIIKEKNGIIFVTGGMGMGKTTTIAAMGAIFTAFTKACAPPCGRRQKSFSSARSATAKRWRSCSTPAKPAIWFSARCTRPAPQ
jgi:twitching motility protein PilT